MEKVVLEAAFRSNTKKSTRGTLRRSGKVPGILYAKTIAPVPVAVEENSINPIVFSSEAHIITLKVDNNQEFDCVVKDVQFDPVTDKVIHFDLQGIVAGEKMEFEVPILTTGSSVGVRDGGVLNIMFHKVPLMCLPADIPEHIEIDVTNLKIGAAVHVRDIKVENAEFVLAPETVIINVTHARSQHDTVAVDGAVAAEPEVIAKGKEKSTEE